MVTTKDKLTMMRWRVNCYLPMWVQHDPNMTCELYEWHENSLRVQLERVIQGYGWICKKSNLKKNQFATD